MQWSRSLSLAVTLDLGTAECVLRCLVVLCVQLYLPGTMVSVLIIGVSSLQQGGGGGLERVQFHHINYLKTPGEVYYW